jgi:rhodanese-related sulfurtransferase
MPVHPFLTGAATAAVLLIIILLLFYRIRHRLRISREMMYLLSQDQYEYLFIDIRSREEFAKGHIPNALNIPYVECSDLLPTENMFEKIYVYGKTRRKARIIAAVLDTTGYFNVAFFGAFRGWKGPIEITEA